MQTFKDRLSYLWRDNPKPAIIARDIGMSTPGFSRIWYNDGLPNTETLIKIQESTGCDLNWLLTGKGTPYLNQEQQILTQQNTGESFDVLGRAVDTSRFVFVPFYQDVHASAGFGYPVNDEDYDYCLAFRKDYISRNITTDIKDLSVITVRGNSMDGLLSHNDLILVNHAKKEPADGLYVLRIGNDLFVKLIQRFPNKLLVKSTNPNYEPFEISLDDDNPDLNIIGKVEWLGRTIV